MRKLHTTLLAAAFVLSAATTAFAQGSQSTQGTSAPPDDPKPATTTIAGDTGLWFVPTAEVVLKGKGSFSLYLVNKDYGQGFTDVTRYPVTFAFGLGNRAEIFGNWTLVSNIDRDTRPLFFTSTGSGIDSGTGGGINPDHPTNRTHWTGNKLGDLWVGGKVNLLASRPEPLAIALRGQVKLPVGDDESGVSSGKADFQIDGIVSTYSAGVEFSGFAGFMKRGEPDGYSLTNGLRWGVGLGFPNVLNPGLRITTELFGERYFDDTITAPAGVGTDGSIVPASSRVKSPVMFALGATWIARNGFFIGGGGAINLTMPGRDEAEGIGFEPRDSHGLGDKSGLQIRLGWHPGSSRTHAAPPPPPPPPPPPVAGVGVGYRRFQVTRCTPAVVGPVRRRTTRPSASVTVRMIDGASS